jgi:hypothetical protein
MLLDAIFQSDNTDDIDWSNWSKRSESKYDILSTMSEQAQVKYWDDQRKLNEGKIYSNYGIDTI